MPVFDPFEPSLYLWLFSDILDQPFLRALAYCHGFHATMFIFAGSIFGIWTSPFWA